MFRKGLVTIFLSVLALSMVPHLICYSSSVLSEGKPSIMYLLADGMVTYEGWNYYKTESAANIYGIESSINESISLETVIESLSDTAVRFTLEYSLNAESAYQKRSGITYIPTSYGIRYLNDEFELLATSDSSYTVTQTVDKETGEIIQALNPYGASIVMFTAYFEEPEVYEWIGAFPIPLAGAGDSTGVFAPNTSLWYIGYSQSSGAAVTDQGEILGHQTWIIEPTENPEGYDDWTLSNQFEQTSGLFMEEELSAGVTGIVMIEYLLKIEDTGEVIDDGYPVVEAPAGKVVSSMEPVELVFEGNDFHFDHYNLYRNGILNQTGTTDSDTWGLMVTPSQENTTWTFEIVDSLGYARNASTWLLYEYQTGPILIGVGATVGIIVIVVGVVYLKRGRGSEIRFGY